VTRPSVVVIIFIVIIFVKARQFQQILERGYAQIDAVAFTQALIFQFKIPSNYFQFGIFNCIAMSQAVRNQESQSLELHFGHFIAGSTDKSIAYMETQMRNMPLQKIAACHSPL
jgi:hypothetical protein